MSADTSELEQLLRTLATADDQVRVRSAALLQQAAQRLAQHAQTIAHRNTGQMADSIYALGPFPTGGNLLESLIDSAAPYTVYELARGGDHDWAARTLDDERSTLDQLEADAVALVIGALQGRRS
jgi:hypothetical protein